MVRRDEALAALRREVEGRRFWSATVVEVTDGGVDGFVLRVRSGQRLDLHTLVLAADEDSLALDHAIGERLHTDDVQVWADGVVIYLMEQLDTGVLLWGRRITLEDGTVAIDPTLEPGPSSPFSVSSVPSQRLTEPAQRRVDRLGPLDRLRLLVRGGRGSVVVQVDPAELEPDPHPGGHLRDAGLDVRPGRAAHADGRLVAWLQLFLDDRGGAPPVGQLVVTWRDESAAVAQLEHLECRPAATRAATEEMVIAGLHAAADAGARWIEHRIGDIDRLELGLRWLSEGDVRRLDAAEVP